jgi:Ni,Fe-hydrogenase I large subunit
MAVQTLDISPVGRVEGDLDVRVDIENGVVTNAWTTKTRKPDWS